MSASTNNSANTVNNFFNSINTFNGTFAHGLYLRQAKIDNIVLPRFGRSTEYGPFLNTLRQALATDKSYPESRSLDKLLACYITIRRQEDVHTLDVENGTRFSVNRTLFYTYENETKCTEVTLSTQIELTEGKITNLSVLLRGDDVIPSDILGDIEELKQLIKI